MSDVTPIRRRTTTLVEPGQTTHDAEWMAGWQACAADLAVIRASALEMGYRQGLQAGRCVGPSWVNVGVCSTFAFIIGFCIAIGYFS